MNNYRYQQLFDRLYQHKIGALVPFLIIGDPNPIEFVRIVDTLVLSGADALELGIPFSDPVSDGPAIQKSISRSFKSGINVSNCFIILKQIRKKYPNIPIGLLVYANLIFKNKIKKFYAYCAELNIDSILIPDVPVEEIAPFYEIAIHYNISQILICPPNASITLVNDIIKLVDKGYIYLSSRPGVTGRNLTKIDNSILSKLIKNIRKQKKAIPILQGFGIYTVDQARESLLLGTSGIILGSVIADIIENNITNIDKLLQQLQQLIQLMKKNIKLNIVNETE